MTQEIIPIPLSLPLNITTVNSYLIKTDDGYFLIDTGFTNARHKLESELARLGCQPGQLKLIILTHGDFDHIGNAVYLRTRFASQIAMHNNDEGMLEYGDMFWNRKIKNNVVQGLMKKLMPFKKQNRGKADILLEDGTSLSDYGLEARVINTPGHSNGSICILTTSGDLFCGDLFTNSTGKAELNQMMYDKPAGIASFEKIKSFAIQTVYPGHGAPFPMQILLN